VQPLAQQIMTGIRDAAGQDAVDQLPSELRALATMPELTSSDMDYIIGEILVMQKAIFCDLMPMHQAYVDGGLPALQEMADAGVFGPEIIDACRDIASGEPARIAAGNEVFLHREQLTVIGERWDAVRTYRGNLGEALTYATTMVGSPSVGGVQPMRSWRPIHFTRQLAGGKTAQVTVPLPDWDWSNFDERWDYITDQLLPGNTDQVDNHWDTLSTQLNTPMALQMQLHRPLANLGAIAEEMDGTRSISRGILMVPDDGRDDATRPVIGYQEANDSVGARCHPSTQWTGSNPMDGSSWSALGPLAMMFDRGWAVMISDVGNDAQESPRGAFAGKYAANILLDGVRSAMRLEDAGLDPQAPVGIFGIAGGGVGAGFAAERAASYAPELNIRGSALEGMVVDQRNFFRGSDGSLGSGFVFATLLGLEPKYPEMDLNSHLTPLGRQLADWYRGECQTPAYFSMPFVPLSALFTAAIPPAVIPEFQHVYDDNLPGAEGASPEAPVLIASCVADYSPMSLVPAADARDLADRYRAGGTPKQRHLKLVSSVSYTARRTASASPVYLTCSGTTRSFSEDNVTVF